MPLKTKKLNPVDQSTPYRELRKFRVSLADNIIFSKD